MIYPGGGAGHCPSPFWMGLSTRTPRRGGEAQPVGVLVQRRQVTVTGLDTGPGAQGA